MALQDGGSLKQDVDQAPSSLQAGTAVGTGETGLCSWSRAMPERFPASTHGGNANWAREPAWSDLSGWRFKTAVCPLLMSHLHCLTSPLRPFAINRGLEPAGHGPCATAKLSPLKFWLHGSLHRRWRVLNSLLERAALLFTHVALTLPLSSKINYRTCFSRVNRLGGFSSVRWASQPMSCTFLAKFCTRGPVNREPQRW